MAIVGDGDRQWILEHANRICEVDLVLSQIGRGLLRIPLVGHQCQCMYECTPLSTIDHEEH